MTPLVASPASRAGPGRADPGEYLLDPNPAVTRAGLVEELACDLGAWQIDPMIAFLSLDVAVSTPFARTLRIVESMPWHEKQVARRLRELGIGSADIRRRGLAGDVQQIHRRLGLQGDRSATIVLTRRDGAPWGLICEDLPAQAHRPGGIALTGRAGTRPGSRRATAPGSEVISRQLEVHDLVAGLAQLLVSAELVAWLDTVVVLQRAVDLGDRAEFLPQEVDPADELRSVAVDPDLQLGGGRPRSRNTTRASRLQRRLRERVGELHDVAACAMTPATRGNRRGPLAAPPSTSGFCCSARVGVTTPARNGAVLARSITVRAAVVTGQAAATPTRASPAARATYRCTPGLAVRLPQPG